MFTLKDSLVFQEQINDLKNKIRTLPKSETDVSKSREQHIASSMELLINRSDSLPERDRQAFLHMLWEEMACLQGKFEHCLGDLLSEYEESRAAQVEQ